MSYRTVLFPENSTFLVTGGAGFIGSNLVDALLERGIPTRVLDNFSTGKRENLAHHLSDPNFHLIEGDLRQMETVQSACKGVTHVLHQGALGSVPRSISDPVTTNDVNVGGTLNLFLAARDQGVKRVVYASSSSVYGDEPTLPKQEARTGRVLSPYALTKQTNEEYARLMRELYGLETIGLRYFNVFGRRQDPDSVYAAVIPIFVKRLLRNESPVIFGDGLQSRDFTYIENVIEANLKAVLVPQVAAEPIYNISYGGRVTLLELYEELCRLLNKTIPPTFGPERPGDIKHSLADISKAGAELGYAPQYSFKEGFALTIDWYREHLS